ncbi:MAG: hypothetical protein A2X36_14590 [Elusimicrobia bacterium GWA2_69_24]|nr:MAG: hypothetical protein A2X36_14590 [Elusimicrobia bacterium GWA2_69_24]HBL18378.1 hypothetical protein [Elusimicrobiota bacterium]
MMVPTEPAEVYPAGREAYYRGLEKIVSDYCAGTLDLRLLLEREQELDRISRELKAREAQIERDLSARQAELERQAAGLKTSVLSADRKQEGDLERALSERCAQMDRTYLSRELALRATEALLRHREKALESREEVTAKGEAELSARVEKAERDLAARRAAAEAELDQRAKVLADDFRRDCERMQRVFSMEKGELIARAQRWEQAAREALDRVAALEHQKFARLESKPE